MQTRPLQLTASVGGKGSLSWEGETRTGTGGMKAVLLPHIPETRYSDKTLEWGRGGLFTFSVDLLPQREYFRFTAEDFNQRLGFGLAAVNLCKRLLSLRFHSSA